MFMRNSTFFAKLHISRFLWNSLWSYLALEYIHESKHRPQDGAGLCRPTTPRWPIIKPHAETEVKDSIDPKYTNLAQFAFSFHKKTSYNTPEMPEKRYARLQVDADAIPDDDKPPQTGHTFNIWFLKWAGGDSSSRRAVLLKFRVNIKRDSGATRGVEDRSPICLFFARGCCYKGRKCPFLHRLPQVTDLRVKTQDCFGRDKTADYRDDMGGVGLLQRENRTLYITGAHMHDLVQAELHKQFSEFGSIDKIRVLHAKNCAFVSYRLEAEAQFAKEAMDAQTLDGKDVLTVKWANDDPNPHAQQLAKRELEEQAMETVKRLLGDEPVQKKSRRDLASTIGFESQEAGNLYEQPTSGNHSREKVKTFNAKNSSSEKAEASNGILDLSRINALNKIRTQTNSRARPVESSREGKITSTLESKSNSEPTRQAPSKNTFLAGYSSDEDSE